MRTTLRGSRLSLANPFFWYGCVVWLSALVIFAWLALREESPLKYLVLAVLALVFFGYVSSVRAFLRMRVTVAQDSFVFHGRAEDWEIEISSVAKVETGNSGDMWSGIFMPFAWGVFKCVVLRMKDGNFILLDEIVGTPGAVRRLVRSLNDRIELAQS